VRQGLGKGTGLLLGKTVHGVFRSAGGIVGGVGNMGALLSADDAYVEERTQRLQDQREKRRQMEETGGGLAVATSVKEGLESVGMGLFSGVTGVFTDTAKGAEKGGILGMGMGLGKGLMGLVAKPVVGVVDAMGGIADGVRSDLVGGVNTVSDAITGEGSGGMEGGGAGGMGAGGMGGMGGMGAGGDGAGSGRIPEQLRNKRALYGGPRRLLRAFSATDAAAARGLSAGCFLGTLRLGVAKSGAGAGTSDQLLVAGTSSLGLCKPGQSDLKKLGKTARSLLKDAGIPVPETLKSWPWTAISLVGLQEEVAGAVAGWCVCDLGVHLGGSVGRAHCCAPTPIAVLTPIAEPPVCGVVPCLAGCALLLRSAHQSLASLVFAGLTVRVCVLVCFVRVCVGASPNRSKRGMRRVTSRTR
jgi:hypothetical protein